MTLQTNFHSQVYSPADLAYQDCVVKSGVDPDVYHLNFDPASGRPVYGLLCQDTDPTTNSGISIEAAQNLGRCSGSAGYFLGNNFYLPSDLAGNTKAARYGIIKSKGIYRPEGPPAYGWICNNRFRQLGGAPIALDLNKSTGVWEPRRYHQPKGKPLEIFFPRITVRIWKLVAEKAGLSMPKYPVVGLKGEALQFWKWVEDTNCPVILTEGEKKAAALISRGYAAIGLPGINSGYRVTEKGDWVTKPDGTQYQRATAWELHPALQPLDTAGRVITTIFDYRAGDYSKSPEFKAASTLSKLFKNAIAKIAQLPGPDKGVDDFCVAGGDIDAVISGAPSFEEIQKLFLKWLGKENKKKAWALTHRIAWECNQRYLNIPYPSSGLICIKSPKGTGKTEALKQLAAKAQAENRKVLVVTHRIVLGEAICSVVEIPWIEDMNSDGDSKIEGKALGHGLCIDSLHPISQALFDPTAFEGALVIFDEVEQISWHALNSSTCRENRQAILSSLKTLIQTVLKSGGQILIQDADLSDISIDFVREFAETNIEPWVAVNHWQPSEPWKIKFYDTQHVKGGTKDDPSGLLKDAVDCVNGGGKIWFSVDSQKVKSKHGSKNLEKYLQSRCPGKKILRIDAETVANPEHPAYKCAKKINELVAHYDIVISSPSLASGVSVKLRGHFTAVFGIFQGAISDNEVRQSLARVREPVNRFVWCRQIAVSKVGNGESNYKEVAKSREKDCRYNLQLLRDFDFDLDKAHNPTVLKYWAKFAARINSSVWDFRETVREGLVAEGHILQDCGDDDRDITGELKALRIAEQVSEAIAVASAADIDKDEFEKLEQQRSKTDAERYLEEKFRLKEIYKTEVTPELRQLHQDRWFGKIQSHYLLTHKEDFLWMRDRKTIDSQVKSGGGQLCIQDIRQLTGKVTVHRLLNILQFCDPKKEWTNKSPEVLEFVAKALKFAADVKTLTGISVSPKKAADNPIGVIQSFLGQLGLRLTGSQRRVGEDRVRFYKFGGAARANIFDTAGNKICEPVGLREQIFEFWKERDELALFEFQHHGIAAVEADVTPYLKSARSMGSYEKDPNGSQFVTPRTIDIEKTPSVTTDSSIETPIEPQPQPVGRMGWVSRWGQWIRASFLAATDGAQYRMLIQELGEWSEVLAWPHQIRWEGQTL